jgi:hypothetical protein
MDEQFKKGFFEFIAAADAEKVHSQTIGWIFSNDCDVFSNEEKNTILNELLSIKNEEIDLIPTKVDVEINDIDILITCGDRWLVVIENKIKSSQHSNQLYKYEYITSPDLHTALNLYKKWKSIEFPDENFESEYLKSNIKVQKELILNWEKKQDIKIKDIIHQDEELKYRNHSCKYVYLTLVKEKPESSNWKNITYSDLYKVLDKYFKNKNIPNVENHSIVKSYLKTIGNLSRVTELFIDSPSNFKFVFTEGKTIKGGYIESETDKGTAKSYIKYLGLETLLQKWFYSKLIEDLKSKNQELFKSIKYNIAETHGTALLDIVFNEIRINGKAHIPILQFQGKAIKLAIVGSSNAETKEILEKGDLISTRNSRKRKFAEGLSESQDFLELTKLNNDVDEITSKISTPRNADGFLSININESDMKFWQVEVDNREQFVINKIEQVQKIFQKLNG